MPPDDDFTPFFNPVPSVMFVAVGEDLADVCAKGCEPVLVLRVAHAAAALQRMVATHPLLLLLGHAVSAADEDALRQHAGAIGTVVVAERELNLEGQEDWMREAIRGAIRARSTHSM